LIEDLLQAVLDRLQRRLGLVFAAPAARSAPSPPPARPAHAARVESL